MADMTTEQVRRDVLDGSDEDLRRLLILSESFAVQARRAFLRAGVGPGWTVIDCGCGPVGALALLAEMVGPAGRVVGVDFSAARHCARRVGDGGARARERGPVRRRHSRVRNHHPGRPVRPRFHAGVPRAPPAKAGLRVVEADGFFCTQDPELGFGIHAGTLAAARERALAAGISAETIDDLAAVLSAARTSGYEWVTSPFLLDLVLRKPKT